MVLLRIGSRKFRVKLPPVLVVGVRLASPSVVLAKLVVAISKCPFALK